MAETEQFYIQWRGAKKGPWCLTTIKGALKSGDIHSMYHIECDGQWQVLRDFLEGRRAKEREEARNAEPEEAGIAKQKGGVSSIGLGRPASSRQPNQDRSSRETQWPLLNYGRHMKRSNKWRLRSVILPKQERQLMLEENAQWDERAKPENRQEMEPDAMVNGGGMEWKHIGIALLFLLGIIAAGFGGYVFIQALTSARKEIRTTPYSRQ